MNLKDTNKEVEVFFQAKKINTAFTIFLFLSCLGLATITDVHKYIPELLNLKYDREGANWVFMLVWCVLGFGAFEVFKQILGLGIYLFKNKS